LWGNISGDQQVLAKLQHLILPLTQPLSLSILSASSSKAVLAALRALQDKIRRLESERALALDENAQLRHQIKNQEIETGMVRFRDRLMSVTI
jgi:septal ring factor EnvC (AmiA/AmiB activator)